uniref:Mitochondrial import inner membrane translocase subunit TIM22 n=1 Tax=Paramoeba aestuarina TaxID=180227 RepID=A0A7S4N8R8_9EUKA
MSHGVDPVSGRPLREPCPERIYADCGGAFAMGCVGGTIFHGLKGFKNSPPGFGRRVYGSVMAVRSKSLVLGGNFGIWGLLFSSFDCSLAYARGQEDAYNAVASGFLTGATLAMRGGWKAAGTAGVFGGLFLAAIEGVSFFMMQAARPPPPQQQPDAPPPSAAFSDTPPSSSSGVPPDRPL